MGAGEGCWHLGFAGSHIQTESARPLFESPHTVHAFANRHRTPVRYRAHVRQDKTGRFCESPQRQLGDSQNRPVLSWRACARYRTGLALRDSLRRNLVHRSMTMLESGDVGERRLRDVFQGFFSEKALVASDDDVRKCEQAREDVIPDDLIRQVFKEEIGLFLINVQAEIAYLAGLQSFDHRLRINQCAAARVDQHDAGFHLAERLGVNQVTRLRRQRAVQRDDVRSGEEMRARHIVHTQPLTVGVWKRIVRQKSTTETFHNLRYDSADFACADDAHGPAMQIETQQSVEGEITFAYAGVGAVYLAVERQN